VAQRLEEGCYAHNESLAALFAGVPWPFATRMSGQRLGIALTNFGTGETADDPNIVFEERWFGFDHEAVRLGDETRRVGGAGERAGDHAVDALLRKALSGGPGLRFSQGAQAEVEAALDDTAGVAFGLPMAHEDEAHYAGHRRS
jgi:hypothetical protein